MLRVNDNDGDIEGCGLRTENPMKNLLYKILCLNANVDREIQKNNGIQAYIFICT